jgi:hypothetical protein
VGSYNSSAVVMVWVNNSSLPFRRKTCFSLFHFSVYIVSIFYYICIRISSNEKIQVDKQHRSFLKNTYCIRITCSTLGEQVVHFTFTAPSRKTGFFFPWKLILVVDLRTEYGSTRFFMLVVTQKYLQKV